MNKYLISFISAPLAWGLSFSLIKQGLASTQLESFYALRFFMACAILLMLFQKGLFDKRNKERIKNGIVLGIILFAHLITQGWVMRYVSATRAGFFTSFYIPLTPVVGFLIFKKRISLKQFSLVALAFFGLCLMAIKAPEGVIDSSLFSRSAVELTWADLSLFLAAGFAAFHIVMTGKIAAGEDNAVALGFWQFLTVGICFVLVRTIEALFLGQTFNADSELFIWRWSQSAVQSLVLLAIFCTAFAFVVQIICQRRVDTVRSAIIFGLEAPFAALFGWWFFNDQLGPFEWIGALLLFGASVIP